MEAITKVPTAAGYRNQIVNLVCDKKQHSDRHYESRKIEFPSYYNLYRGAVTKHAWKNSVHLPLIFATIQSDCARKVQASFGTYPIVTMLGYGPDDAPIARKREALVDAQMKDADSFLKAVDVHVTADLYGTTVIQYGWETRVERRIRSGAMNGQRILTNEDRVVFDGPNWEVIDLMDFYPQPGFIEIEKMQWCVVRKFMDLEDIRDLAAQDIYDGNEVARMEREGGGAPNADTSYKVWRTWLRGESEEGARVREKYSRPVEILEFWGTIPSELVPGDGARNRVITVANERYLLRNRPNPFWNGKKPFLNYSPMRDPHNFFAPGKAEISQKLQIVANRFTNQVLDALDIFIDPIFFYNRDSGLETRNLMMQPGKFIPMDGAPGDQIFPLIPNLQGVQAGTEQSQMVWRWMQAGTGIVEDVAMGIPGNRQTAREFLGRQESVATRLIMEARIAEEMFLEPLANAFNELDEQFLETPKEIAIIGDAAITDPITGMPIQSTMDTISAMDMVPSYRARAQGAQSRLNRATKQQNLVLLMQAASANPQVAMTVNWVNFFRLIFREFEMGPNINDLINENAILMQQMQMAGFQNAGQVPGLPGAPSEVGEPSGDIASMIGTLTQGAPSA